MGSVKSKKTTTTTTTTTTTYIRRANYAGSWYKASASALDVDLTQFLQQVDSGPPVDEASFPLRALIAPHAGYSYSGPTAAYAYRELSHALASRREEDVNILVLHPSHYEFLQTCTVSGAHVIQTPLGDLAVNDDLRQEILSSSDLFTVMRQTTDEQEHSGELHYPYIQKACRDASYTNCKILPIMVGSLNVSQEDAYGKLLAPIVARPNVLTVVSSDFCHWGSRFSYQPYLSSDSKNNNISNLIEELDRTGMSHVELQDPGAFAKYLKSTSNSICGRHPIGVWLRAIQHNATTNTETLNVKFIKYAQSSRIMSSDDSSVSYASAVARRTNELAN